MGDLTKLVNITWPDHFRVFLTGMWTCFLEKYRTDLEVYCSGHRVNVHQVVLSIFCPVFKQQLQQEGQDFNLNFDSPVGLEEADLGLLIEFLYRGKINVSRDRLGILREAGLAFGLQVLVDLIDQEDGNRVVPQDANENSILNDQDSTDKVDEKSSERLADTEEDDKTVMTELTAMSVVTSKRSRRSGTRYESLRKVIPKIIKNKRGDGNVSNSSNQHEMATNLEEMDIDTNEIEDKNEEDLNDSSEDNSEEKSGSRPKKRDRTLSEIKNRGIRKPKQFLKCPHCSYGTNRKQLYLNHLDTHDRSVKRYVCDICSKAFRNNSSFGRHVYFHKNPDKLLRCTHCNYNTMQRSVWVQHLAIRHQLDPDGNSLKKDIRCPDCDFVCITDYQLKSHTMRKHSSKSFKCEECDYCSVMRADLEKHVQIRHRNDRPYMCETCGYRSKTRSHFNCHLQMHTGIKPFKCHICGQAYTRSNKLKEHLRSHVSDEKPFLCHLCSYACRRNYNLKLHIKRIHKDGTVGKGRGSPRSEKQTNVINVQPVEQVNLMPDLDQDNVITDNDLKLGTPPPLQPQAVIQLQTMEPIAVMSEVALTTVCMTGLDCLQPFHSLE